MSDQLGEVERLRAALRLIAQRAQIAGPGDAGEALRWIYWHATEATNG